MGECRKGILLGNHVNNIIMTELKHYISAFSSLHTAKVKGYKAPHKAVLLLAIIDLIEEKVIVTQHIGLSDGLIEKFNEVWHRYLGTSAIFSLDICKPYFHMQHESFWRLVEKEEAELDMAAEPNPWVASRKQRKELPKGSYSVGALRRAFAYAEIDEMLLHLLQNSDARAMLRVILINTYLSDQPTKTMPSINALVAALPLLALVA